MKLGPNACMRMPNRTGPFTMASCNGGCESRESRETSRSRYCTVVPLSGQPCEPSRWRNEHFPLVAACDAPHTLPEHGLRHPWNEWLRGCF